MKPPERLGLTWTKEGKVPFVYPKKAPGQRCGWSVTWMIPHPRSDPNYPTAQAVTVEDWQGCSPSEMSDAELMAELADGAIVGPHPFDAQAAALVLDNEHTEHDRWRQMAGDLVLQLRQSYKQVVAEWNPPDPKSFHMPPPHRKSWG